MSVDTLRIMHLSDIHYGETNDGLTPNYKHDLRALKGIQDLLDAQKPDLLVVSGDITNIGDKLNLDRAYQWIHDRVYVDGEYYGLECTKRGIATTIVPGNHDAFNAPTNKSNLHRWQSSLRNYYASFPEYGFEDPETCVDYAWITKGKTNLFICRVDSCFLGDPETEHLAGSLSLSRVAKGKFSRAQSEKMMRIYDQGVRGELKDRSGSAISAGAFMRSLKILVMHHYLFEPSDAKAEPLLQLNDKISVFQNLAMSDFDVLLCGHKHIADVQVLSYLDHFDPRARLRYAVNYVRRSLGISSLPMRTDAEGRLLSKIYRLVLGLLYMSRTNEAGLTDEAADEIVHILGRSLENPSILKEELLNYSRQRLDLRQSGLFDEEEMRDLHARIRKAFSEQQQRRLMQVAATLRGMLAKLGGRSFAHISVASSAKSSETTSRGRAVNLYEVTDDAASRRHDLVIKRFPWQRNRRAFGDPVMQEISFTYDRLAIPEIAT